VAVDLRIDSHLHLYETKAAGLREKETYEIWEYGPKQDVVFARFGGDIEDAEAAMAESGYTHAVIANLFAIALLDEGLRSAHLRVQAERLIGFNQWACDVAATHRQLSAFVAVDPTVLGGDPGAAHLREMVEGHGARGVKIHPVVQRFLPDDARMYPIYQACAELGIPVLSHSGSDRDDAGFAETAFAAILRRFPDFNLVLAHLGGGAWRQNAAFAQAFPQVSFDLCEIIAWTGAPKAPSARELAKLILHVGPQRVMLGTDFHGASSLIRPIGSWTCRSSAMSKRVRCLARMQLESYGFRLRGELRPGSRHYLPP
jgi:predicted TIM-barrel fold metal-dependent hydrolase